VLLEAVYSSRALVRRCRGWVGVFCGEVVGGATGLGVLLGAKCPS
jgi:hypothetical protein